MPTATSLAGYSLLNNGPLTTAFTAPASCSTAYQTMIGLATDPADIEWPASCDFVPPADCNPNGAVIQSIESAAQGPNPLSGNIIVYHSPGLVCPSGWETVGAAARLSPASTSVSGAFNFSTALPTGNAAFAELLPALDVILAALDVGETAALCCPGSVDMRTLYNMLNSSLDSTYS